jgi:hypothetical protein
VDEPRVARATYTWGCNLRTPNNSRMGGGFSEQEAENTRRPMYSSWAWVASGCKTNNRQHRIFHLDWVCAGIMTCLTKLTKRRSRQLIWRKALVGSLVFLGWSLCFKKAKQMTCCYRFNQKRRKQANNKHTNRRVRIHPNSFQSQDKIPYVLIFFVPPPKKEANKSRTWKGCEG